MTVATLAAQAPVPASAPANSWPQFRGSASLSGNTAATVPATLKLLWTYDAGDAIESSAAIADDVVYVGSRTGELVAIGLADGSVKWKYKTSPDGIGESSPAVAGGLVYVGDLSGVLHAVDAASGKAAWTFKTNGELKSSPVVAGDRVLDRVVRHASLRARRQGRKTALEVPDGRLRPCHARRRQWRGLRDGMRRDPPRDPDCRRQRGAERRVRRLHGCVARDCGGPSLLRHVRQRGPELSISRAGKYSGDTSAPTATFPFIPRRHYPEGTSSSAGGTSWCTPSIARPGKPRGPFPRARESTLLPSLPAGGSTSDRMTASCTSSTARAGRACSSSKPEDHSPRHLPWLRARSSSDRRTGSCSVWGDQLIAVFLPV